MKKDKKRSYSLYGVMMSFGLILYSIGGITFDAVRGSYVGFILLGGIIFFLSVSIYTFERMRAES
ncbi:MAG: hypothetical protein DRI86_14700 [Bacteroidetes bacterium]|nr:MAG: hypothetical protein DRI86_14700 [Bacteroidota bacterium]